ncbi:MAG: polysaccharide deacetylase family protein [Calditrichaeota bacterium]|nr:polysaccharide deacetylase family protein [Calditrichota bacterium]
MKRGFSVLAYHMVEPRFDFGITRVTPAQFRRHVRLFEDLGWPLVRLDAVWKADDQPRLAVTFDDAYLSIYEHALPLLAERNWPATVFVVAGYTGRLNTWDVNLGGLRFPHADWPQLREMAALGWQIGSHGYSHRYLGFLSGSELRRELEDSKALLEDRLGVRVTAFAPPYGRISRRVLEAAAEAGYTEIALLYASQARSVFLQDGVAVIPRRTVYLLDAVTIVRGKIAGGALVQRFFDLTQAVVGLGSRGSILVQLFQTKVWPAVRRMFAQ